MASSSSTFTPAEIRVVVSGAMLSMFLAALDQTIVAPALPPIARDLGDFDLISWIVTAYLLTSTCCTPIIGKLSDLYGRRRTLIVCLAIFMLGSALCAAAPNMLVLVLARGMQGIGGGGLIPLAQTIVADVVSPRERGRYAAYFSIVWASSSVLGPTVGGLVTERYGWPWIFWINLPLGLIALVIADRALRRLPVARHRRSIDYASSALLSGAIVALLLVLSLGGQRLPWTALPILALGGAALAFGALFARLQLRSAEPILPPRFLADRVIRPILAANFIVYGSYLAVIVLVPVYLQVALGAPVSTTGLLMIPFMLSMTVTANLAGRYSRRTGRYKRPSLYGLPITIMAIGLIAGFAQRLSPIMAAGLLVAAGLGLGPTFPCSTVAVQNAVERHDLGVVSGALAFARALGSAIAIAAASALVLALAAGALPDTGQASSLEDLARQALPPSARAIVAWAFGVVFGALAAAMSVGLVFFMRVEDRALHDNAALGTLPAAD